MNLERSRKRGDTKVCPSRADRYCTTAQSPTSSLQRTAAPRSEASSGFGAGVSRGTLLSHRRTRSTRPSPDPGPSPSPSDAVPRDDHSLDVEVETRRRSERAGGGDRRVGPRDGLRPTTAGPKPGRLPGPARDASADAPEVIPRKVRPDGARRDLDGHEPLRRTSGVDGRGGRGGRRRRTSSSRNKEGMTRPQYVYLQDPPSHHPPIPQPCIPSPSSTQHPLHIPPVLFS